MSILDMKSHINLESKLGDLIQVLQFQAIDHVHIDNNDIITFVLNLNKVDQEFPIFRFSTRINILEGDVELEIFDKYYPGLASNKSYIYLKSNAASPNIKIKLI